MILKQLFTILRPQMKYTPFYLFTRKTKAAALILHSSEQIQKMIIRKQKKDQGKQETKKSWKRAEGQTLKKFRVSLVGLPNSGKSSLFNCLVGQRIAIVDKQYGLTRDRKQFPVLQGLASIIDTPGVEVKSFKLKESQQLKEDIFRQTITALHESDLILLVIDAKKPVTGEQIQFAKYLKSYNKSIEVVVVCNKCDGLFDQGDVLNEASKLNFQKVMTCSAEEGTGVLEILTFINQRIPYELKSEFQKRRLQRVAKFEAVIKKLKSEIQALNQTNREFKIKEWEKDFRMINDDPEDNQDLDYQNFEDHLVRPEQTFSNKRGAQIKNLRMKNSIKICFIGRPNVGKSTLINQLIGSDKMIVSEVPHTTRDTISSKIEYKNRKIELIDTAGLNTPRIMQNNDEYLRKVQISTMMHVEQSHLVVYVMDAFEAFKIDDFDLIQRVIKEGRPLVIVVNKWEAVKEQFRYKAKNYLLHQLQKNLGQLHGDPLVFVSAKLQLGIDEMMDKIITTYDKWNTRISTGLLNDWLQNFKKLDKLPKSEQLELKINYIIQARVRPPLFIFFVNSKKVFKPNYMRFVMRNLAKQFGMDGIPLRITLRSTNNSQKKYSKKKAKENKKVSPMKKKMQQLKKKYGNLGK